MPPIDPFEKILQGEQKSRAFPLGLCIAAILATGAGLAASAAGIQWGATPPEPDALQLSWLYVNIAWIWTWLLVWPAISLSRRTPQRLGLLLEFIVILLAALPAAGVSGFLTGISQQSACGSLALQIAAGLLAMGVMAWRTRIPPAALAGVLAALAVAVPILAYVWMEFFPAMPQSWIDWMLLPAVVHATVARPASTTLYWIASVHALIGVVLLVTAGSAIAPGLRREATREPAPSPGNV